jgi:hypothetical protein
MASSRIPKWMRMAEVFRRMHELPPAASRDEARRMLDQTLNEVEDELSGAPFDPANWNTDQRMYPVQDDNVAPVEGRPGVTSYVSRKHETLIRDNGAIEVRNFAGVVVFEKAGADKKGVWE